MNRFRPYSEPVKTIIHKCGVEFYLQVVAIQMGTREEENQKVWIEKLTCSFCPFCGETISDRKDVKRVYTEIAPNMEVRAHESDDNMEGEDVQIQKR